jgi:hypothetical protein
VENNLLCDPAKFPGIIIGTFQGASLVSGIVRGNVIIRGGGNAYNQNMAALVIGTGRPGDPHVANVVVSGNLIVDSILNAVEFENASNITFQGNTIDRIFGTGNAKTPARAVRIESNAVGSATVSNNILKRLAPGQIPFVNHAPGSTFKVAGVGNVGFKVTPGPSAPRERK